MLSTYFITNLLTILFLFVFNGTLSYSSYNRNRSFKLYTLFFSLVMLAELLYCVISTKTLRSLNDFNLTFDILNFKLDFALEGFTVIFCFLTALLIFICILLIWDKKYFFEQAICLFLVQLFVIAAFTVKDIFFFYVFFEAIVLPMYVMITKFGSRDRKVRAAQLLLYYTLVSSALLLIAIGGIYSFFGTTSYDVLLSDYGLKSLPRFIQDVLWVVFFVSFATKMPLVPFHTWLPEAHVEASTPGSVLLAGILLKLGLYGLIVFCSNMLPAPSEDFAKYVFIAAIAGAVYTGILAIRQQDLKRVIAYSSVSHMCTTTLGVFSLRTAGIQAGLYQGISHGFVSVALFALIGFIYDRFGSRDIQKYSGLARVMPLYTISLLFFTLANLAMPGFSSFIGEFGLMYVAFGQSITGGLLVLTTVIVVGGYSLLLNNRVLFGDLNKISFEILQDLNTRELFISIILAFFVIILGVYAELITDLFCDDLSPTLAELYQFCDK
jgi:NADH-quinone oxidoreductase subunit M